MNVAKKCRKQEKIDRTETQMPFLDFTEKTERFTKMMKFSPIFFVNNQKIVNKKSGKSLIRRLIRNS